MVRDLLSGKLGCCCVGWAAEDDAGGVGFYVFGKLGGDRGCVDRLGLRKNVLECV